MVPEAPLERADGGGLVPQGEGWFVLNAKEARWLDGDFGAFTRFEGSAARFPQIGINIGVLAPGQAACMYHGEDEQEDFLVLQGACVLLIEGEERALRAWDFVHCPAWTEHVFVGAGDGPCAILAIGGRTGGKIVYPESELAQSHGAGVASATPDPDKAYAGSADDVPTGYREGWLPG
ncbi:MAG: cupin domain-containing protein [Actinobacteria bacterium]|nr:cupin domain-containing protein [Actinomycetota bacterium]